MHKGDIILNLWASKDNPARISIIKHIGAVYTTAYYECKGNLTTCQFYTRELKKDQEHFKIIDHLDYEKPIRDRLKLWKRSDTNDR